MNTTDKGVTMELSGGLWMHAKPARDTSWLHRWRRERGCAHEWHPESATGADWFCCKCGREK